MASPLKSLLAAGTKLWLDSIDPELVVNDEDLSLATGVIAPWSGFRGEYFNRVLEAVAATYGFSTTTPWKRLKKADREVVGLHARLSGIPPATGRRRVSLVLTLAPRQRGGDPDAYWKSTLDALTACGLLSVGLVLFTLLGGGAKA